MPPLHRLRPRTGKLGVEDLRKLWLGLDQTDLPCHPIIAVPIKFMIATMLRSCEVRHARKDEVMQHEEAAVYHVPLKHVKGRRHLQVPLTKTKAANRPHISAYLFTVDGGGGNHGAGPARREVQGKVWQRGICEWLSIQKVTPHDLRHTAAHLTQVNAKQPKAKIALCLDHSSDEAASQLTDESCVQSQHLSEKLEVLTAWETVLQDIIAGKVTDSAKVMPLNLAA
ncbi:hypothetical protein [Bradyrhizobium lablabi]|uniref:hypothetical protein n=1 Tax=Bradyrhizobium lablabi TaxID=722472 RepID=UPI001BA6D6C0|nr:hypothetical protein [Bradyrhizobium lablabi]MBR0694589.1 hypothetical protein [Bradyrhizobium lablabi]